MCQSQNLRLKQILEIQDVSTRIFWCPRDRLANCQNKISKMKLNPLNLICSYFLFFTYLKNIVSPLELVVHNQIEKNFG